MNSDVTISLEHLAIGYATKRGVKTVAGKDACHPSEGLLRDLKLFSRHFGVAIPYESELGKTSDKK